MLSVSDTSVETVTEEHEERARARASARAGDTKGPTVVRRGPGAVTE